jgi:hypothetical protein
MIRGFPRLPRSVRAVPGRHVHFAAQDGREAALARLVVEGHCREHVAVFGDRQCRHLEPGGLIEQLVDAAGPIEQGELGVTMEVNEVLISHWIGN